MLLCCCCFFVFNVHQRSFSWLVWSTAHDHKTFMWGPSDEKKALKMLVNKKVCYVSTPTPTLSWCCEYRLLHQCDRARVYRKPVLFRQMVMLIMHLHSDTSQIFHREYSANKKAVVIFPEVYLKIMVRVWITPTAAEEDVWAAHWLERDLFCVFCQFLSCSTGPHLFNF